MITRHCNIISILLLFLFTIAKTAYTTNQNEIQVSKKEEHVTKLEKVLPDLTHNGREHVTEKIKIKDNSLKIAKLITSNGDKNGDNILNNTTNATVTKISAKNNTIHTNGILQTIKSNSSTTPNNSLPILLPSSTEKAVKAILPISVPKKPLVTVHDDEVNSQPKKESVATPNILNIDTYLSESNHKRSNYVVPIVAVILSVPLVAALISILYKRGKYWWLHRNYRRMDYLIEGLYNG